MLMWRLGTPGNSNQRFILNLAIDRFTPASPVERLNIAKVLMFGNGGSKIVH